MQLPRFACALSLVLLACGGGSDTSATDTTGATEASGTDGTTGTTGTDPTEAPDTDTDGEPLAPECACLADEASCGAELCPGVGLDCEEPACDPAHPVNDEAALQCTLEALRDREAGKVSWFVRESLGQYASGTTVYVQADGSAIVTRSGGADLCSYWGPDTRHALAEPAYFDDCLALPTGRERFDCLVEGLGEELQVCVPEAQSCES